MNVAPEITAKFEVLAKLGEGGMGCVYKVRHRDLDEIRIVKTLQSHLSANADLKNRFLHEARRGVRLRHPRIAAVHDFSLCSDGTGFIVMEYVEGLNLRDVLTMRGPLAPAEVTEIACQTLDALEYLHAKKIVHRDISPDNLMVNWDDDGHPSVKLIDLGIAKSLDDTMSGTTMHTVQGQFVGKMLYASPEQFGRAAGTSTIDTRSDLYSLGIVLFELLTREAPFESSSSAGIMAAHLFHAPRSFDSTAMGQGVPIGLQKLVYRALEKDPDDRFQTAADMREALRHAAAGPEPRTLEDAAAIATVVTHPDSFVSTMDVPAPAPPPAEPLDSLAMAKTRIDLGVRLRRLMRYAPYAAAVVLVIVAAVIAKNVDWGNAVRNVTTASKLKAVAPVAGGRFYAIVIGEGRYAKLPPLDTAENDARSVASLLQQEYGFEVKLLLNADRTAIWRALEESRKQLTSADNLVIFYAGHGTFDPVNETGYWQPVDADPANTARWISAGQVAELLDYHPAKRALVIADSCYAGSVGLDPATAREGAREQRLQRKSRIAWTSGTFQPILDAGDGQHSIFTRALLTVMRDAKTLEVQDAYAQVKREMKSTARRAALEQEPQLSAILDAGHEGGGFVFVRTN